MIKSDLSLTCGECCFLMYGMTNPPQILTFMCQMSEDKKVTMIMVRSFGMPRSSTTRLFLVDLAASPTFRGFIFFLILINCALLAVDSPPRVGAERVALDVVQIPIYGSFIFEMLVLVVGGGPATYWQDSWNRMDFFVVVLGLLGYLPGMGNYSGIRTVRILRPLRTITGVKGMRQLVVTLLRSLPMLFDVLILVFFAFFIFGIIGVQLFMSKTSQRCAILGNPASGCESCGLQDDAGYTGCATSCA